MPSAMKGANMLGSNLENAYTYESERRKDEMRAAADSQLVSQVPRRRKSLAWSITVLTLLAWLLLSFLG
jgi:hypothetical protein